MSAGEKHLSKNSAMPCSFIKTEQNNGKRSFIITMDDNGKIEVSPNPQGQQNSHQNEVSNQKIGNESHKVSRGGKQRIRIALLEDDGGSSEDELDKSDMISIDAQSLETMHDRFVKIYNKKLRGKPSFVVLEDAIVRKRMEQTLQDTICHSHAQQQTSPCDIGAHTGSQTDEFLLQYAMHSRMLKGESRGCQATDASFKPAECSGCNNAVKKNIDASTLRQLSQMCAVQLANKLHQHKSNPPLQQSAAAAASATAESAATPAKTDTTAAQVTISFLAPNSQTAAPTMVSPQQQQPLMATAPIAHNNYANCCSSMPPAASYNNCCQQMPAASYSQYCQQSSDNNYGNFLKPPMQQTRPPQQQLGTAATYGNCCSSCCLLRPALAQTTLAYGHSPGMPTHCSHPLLLTPDSSNLQQRLQPQDYAMATWVPQGINNCFCYPMNAYRMSTYQIPQFQHYANCYDDHQQQQQQQMKQQQYVCPVNESNMDSVPPSPSLSNPKQHIKPALKSTAEIRARRERARKPQAQETSLLDMHKQAEVKSSVSQVTVRRMRASSCSEKIAKKVLMQHARHKAGASFPTSKLYMARFGRTCLILKPSAVPSRVPSKRFSRYSSVTSWPETE